MPDPSERFLPGRTDGNAAFQGEHVPRCRTAPLRPIAGAGRCRPAQHHNTEKGKRFDLCAHGIRADCLGERSAMFSTQGDGPTAANPSKRSARLMEGHGRYGIVLPSAHREVGFIYSHISYYRRDPAINRRRSRQTGAVLCIVNSLGELNRPGTSIPWSSRDGVERVDIFGGRNKTTLTLMHNGVFNVPRLNIDPQMSGWPTSDCLRRRSHSSAA